jgi:hypothetical protein
MGNGTGDKKTTLGKVISAVAKAGSSAVEKSKRFLVGTGTIKNDGRVTDGRGAVIFLDAPPELSTTEILELHSGRSIEVSSSDYSLPPNFVLAAADWLPKTTKKLLNPETPLKAEPVARGLFRMGVHRANVKEAVGGSLSESELTKASLKAQSSDNTNSDSLNFTIQARELSEDNSSEVLASDQDDGGVSGSFEVVKTEEFERMMDEISPDFEQEAAKAPEKKPEKPEGKHGDGQSSGD